MEVITVINVTEKAREKLTEIMAKNNVPYIRIHVGGG